MKNFIPLTAVCLLLAGCGCNNQNKALEYVEETEDVTENKTSHFFSVNNNFNLSVQDITRLRQILKDARGAGIENVGYMIISNENVLEEVQDRVSAEIKAEMELSGFLESRIVDSGVCVYKDAKKGVRIDILDYQVNMPDISPWKETLGSCDVEQDMPNYGRANMYNLEAVVANKADLISPRKYRGPHTGQSIKSISELSSSSK